MSYHGYRKVTDLAHHPEAALIVLLTTAVFVSSVTRYITRVGGGGEECCFRCVTEHVLCVASTCRNPVYCVHIMRDPRLNK